MTAKTQRKVSLASYMEADSLPPVFRLRAKASFSPLDLNVAFLIRTGWVQSVDRLRFHVEAPGPAPSSHPAAALLSQVRPHLLVRKLDRDEDRFVAIQAWVDGTIHVLSNDSGFAHEFVAGLFLECPPSFKTPDDIEVDEEWVREPVEAAMFAGMLAGAFGWDPAHGIPDNIRESLDEARRSLDIANYRSCVVMCRRTVEGVLRFGFSRLLGRPATNRRGRPLMLAAMVDAFREADPPPIPAHLLHLMDSVRRLGNVPGAHAADIEGYHFGRTDAEFALYATHHFLDLYFQKLDPEVSEYYTLTVDLKGDPGDGA